MGYQSPSGDAHLLPYTGNTPSGDALRESSRLHLNLINGIPLPVVDIFPLVLPRLSSEADDSYALFRYWHGSNYDTGTANQRLPCDEVLLAVHIGCLHAHIVDNSLAEVKNYVRELSI